MLLYGNRLPQPMSTRNVPNSSFIKIWGEVLCKEDREGIEHRCLLKRDLTKVSFTIWRKLKAREPALCMFRRSELCIGVPCVNDPCVSSTVSSDTTLLQSPSIMIHLRQGQRVEQKEPYKMLNKDLLFNLTTLICCLVSMTTS